MSLFPFKILDPSPERKESNHISSLKGHGSGSLQGPLFPYPKRLQQSDLLILNRTEAPVEVPILVPTSIFDNFPSSLYYIPSSTTYFLTLTTNLYFLVTSFQLQFLHS